MLPWRTVLELYRDRKEKGSETEGGRIEVKKKEVGEEIEVKREGIGEGIGEGIEVESRGTDVEDSTIKDLTADELEIVMSEEDFIANERECMDEGTDFDDQTSRSAAPSSIHHPLVDHMGREKMVGAPADTSKPFPLQTFLTLFNRPSTSACVPKPASSTCTASTSTTSTPLSLDVPTPLVPQPYRDAGVSVSPRMATLLRELADLVTLELKEKNEGKREERLKDGSGREEERRREGSGNDEWLKIG